MRSVGMGRHEERGLGVVMGRRVERDGCARGKEAVYIDAVQGRRRGGACGGKSETRQITAGQYAGYEKEGVGMMLGRQGSRDLGHEAD